MKSALLVPAHVSEKLFAASSTAFRSFTPKEESSPSAFCVSKVAVTVFMASPVMVPPIPAMAAPAFCMVPKAELSLLTLPDTLLCTPFI